MLLNIALTVVLSSQSGQIIGRAGQYWAGHGGNATHSAMSAVPSRNFDAIAWTVPMDLAPLYSGNSLLIHYGVPCITNLNVVITSQKQNLTNDFKIRAYNSNGTPLWVENTDYTVPPQGWIPSCGPSLVNTRGNFGDPMVAYPMGGGRVAFRSAHSPTATPVVHAFYGNQNFANNPSAFINSVKICTPLTNGSDGSIYFGFTIINANPLNLESGLAKVDKSGNASWIRASTLAGDLSVNQIKFNCAPAIDAKNQNLYITTNTGSQGRGFLTRVDPNTMQVLSRVRLLDPRNGNDAPIDNQGTSSPLIGPDGDVYQGVLIGSNNCRGLLLHYSKDLSQTKTPCAFGWDDTPSIIPRTMVGGYTGNSSYLLFCKYNNYAGCGGPGTNRIAVVDPNATAVDDTLGIPTMKVIDSLLCPTPDEDFPGSPGAVREWCVNSAAVDVARSSVIVSAEDGVLYRWNLQTHSIAESIRLTAGIGEAYTPTAIGVDGRVFAIANAKLYAIGSNRL